MKSSHYKSLRVAACAALASLVLSAVVASPAAAIDDIATIATGAGATRVAFTPDGRTAFSTNQDDDTVSVITVATYQAVNTIPVGDQPYGIKVSPDGSTVYVVNFGGASVSVIDVASETVVDTIAVGILPFDVEFSADSAKAYVAGYGAGEVNVIDVATGTVTSTIAASQPQGIALSPDGTFLYVTGISTTDVLVIDVATDTIVDTISDPSFQWADSVVFAPDGLRAYVSNNTGNTISIIDVTLGVVIGVIDVADYPQFVDISSDGKTLYVTHGENVASNGVQLIDLDTFTVSPLILTTGNPYSATVSPDGNLVYVTNNSDASITVLADPVTRVSGPDRYAVAINISQQAYPSTARVVYVATGANYPDALSAGPAAAVDGGPLLLTPGNSLPAAVKAEITRLDPARIYVVGGTGSVSTNVFNQLVSIVGAGQVFRLAGATRYEASRNIVAHAFATAATVYVATGRNFPDALSASAIGAGQRAPVLLVDGAKSTVDAPTLALLATLNPSAIKIAGGPGSVSNGLETQLNALYPTIRLSGADRYSASLAINQDAFNSANRVFLATGATFPDALAGAAWAGLVNGPLFSVPKTCIPAATLAEILSLGAYQVTLLGGPGSLTQSVFDLTACP